jgi:hypothetical protein
VVDLYAARPDGLNISDQIASKMITWRLTNSSTSCAFSARRMALYTLLRSQSCSITNFAWALRLEDKKSLGACRVWRSKLRSFRMDAGY